MQCKRPTFNSLEKFPSCFSFLHLQFAIISEIGTILTSTSGQTNDRVSKKGLATKRLNDDFLKICLFGTALKLQELQIGFD